MSNNPFSGPGSLTQSKEPKKFKIPEGGIIFLIRCGEAQHNKKHKKSVKDPFLTTPGGVYGAQGIRFKLPVQPDLILISPLSRSLQTAKEGFLLHRTSHEIWTDLREVDPATSPRPKSSKRRDAYSSSGSDRSDLRVYFPQLFLTGCPRKWSDLFPDHRSNVERAEEVRKKIKEIVDFTDYKVIAVVGHHGFLGYLAEMDRLDFCEVKAFTFGDPYDVVRYGINGDTGRVEDFGPTVLCPLDPVPVDPNNDPSGRISKSYMKA